MPNNFRRHHSGGMVHHVHNSQFAPESFALDGGPINFTLAGAERSFRRIGFRSSTALSTAALLLASAVIAPQAHAASCATDQAGNAIFNQTCTGSDGAPGKKGQSTEGIGNGNQSGKPGGDGETTSTINQTLSNSYDGVTGKPTLYFSGIGGNGGVGGQGGDLGFGGYSNGGAGGNGGSGSAITVALSKATAQDSETGQPTLTMLSAGGNGADGGALNFRGTGGQGGAGGNGGALTLTEDAASVISNRDSGTAAVILKSTGGNGGNAQSASTNIDTARGATGGAGGNGGNIQATVSGSILSDGPGVIAESHGGNGGNGGDATNNGSAVGGVGGSGGTGGSISLYLIHGLIDADAAPSATVAVGEGGASVKVADAKAAMVAVSTGGVGGAGGLANGGFGNATGGIGGGGSANGNVSVASLAGTISTSGDLMAGELGQSIGGSSGNGGYAGAIFVAKGGQATPAGDGGDVFVTAEASGAPGANGSVGTITTSGVQSSALVAQSIGGGGGYGGDAQVSGLLVGIALGGIAGSGGNGGNVHVFNGAQNDAGSWVNGQIIQTFGARAHGIVGQSIGGGGGIGGDTVASTFLAGAAVAIGGNGGAGGNGGTIVARNAGIIQTGGDLADAVLLQSIGGGGGSGGSSAAMEAGVGLNASTAIGGSGGNGGSASSILFENFNQITTDGGDSNGILAQSIGGGGGKGGSSVSRLIDVFPPNPELPNPSIDVSVAIGGSGGNGGNGGDITATNTGSIITNGTGSRAVELESIGGGGGDGGTSDILHFAVQTPLLSSDTAIGGSGGSGGRGGNITFTNATGSIETYGDNAIAISAQSIGGGGGNGGNASTRDLNVTGPGNTPNVSANLAIGGSGGTGNTGGDVTIKNMRDGRGAGQIATFGIGSRAITAQSIGGGGGIGGGAVAMGSGSSTGTFAFQVGVGGTGGSGNNGGKVTVDNSGTILTMGGNSAAIFGQSVGGGGGIGGSGAGESGSSGKVQIADFLADRMGFGGDVTEIANKVFETTAQIGEAKETIDHLKKVYEAYEKASLPDAQPTWGTNAKSLIGVNVGGGYAGKGGSGGNGGEVDLTNSGTIETDGAESDAIFAQSIGGGGGDGGAALSSAKSSTFNANFAVGGDGGSSGAGGTINITNSGDITTTGDLSNGINAQSVGAGGGHGGGTVGTAGPGNEITLSLGGKGGSQGNGGDVTVNSGGTLTLSGKGSIGIIAQSIGGGGGEVSLLGTAFSPGGDAESDYDHGLLPSVPGIKIGGSGGAGGNGGLVTVTESGSIATSARDSYGILAQSIGGGGGIVLTPLSTVSRDTINDMFGEGTLTGNGGAVNVTLASGASIVTKGAGAVGILAQSIGGGGGLVGGMSDVNVYANVAATDASKHSGTGGMVTISVQPQSRIETYGANAHGIVAQVASGGGFFAGEGGTGFSAASTSSTACSSCGVDLELNSYVLTHGAGSYSAYVQVSGQKSPVNINIGGNGVIQTSDQAIAAIYVDAGNASPVSIVNNGYIVAASNSGVAIDGATANITNNYFIQGDINTRSADLTGHTILNNGTIWAYRQIMASTLTNRGRIVLGSFHGGSSQATITGNLVSTGDIISTLDSNGHLARLQVNGTASLSGRILILGSHDMAKPQAVLSATSISLTGPLSAAPVIYDGNTETFSVVQNSPFNYTTALDSQKQNLMVTQRLSSASQLGISLTSNQAAIADALSRVYASPTRAGQGQAFFGGLEQSGSNVNQYAAAIDTVGGQAIGALAASRLSLQRGFIDSMMRCPANIGDGRAEREADCVWARISGSWIDSQRDVGFSTNATRYQMGGQREIGDHWFLGGSMSYEEVATNSTGAQSNFNGNVYSLGAFVKHQTGDLLIGASVSGAFADYNSRREVAFSTAEAQAHPKVQNLGLQMRISYLLPHGGWYLKPSFDITAQYLHMNKFTETGSDLPLTITSSGDWSFSTAPTLEFGAHVRIGNASLRPYVQAGGIYQHSANWSHQASFAAMGDDLGTFESRVDLPKWIGRVAAGAEIYGTRQLSINAQYGAELGKKFNTQDLVLRLNYLF